MLRAVQVTPNDAARAANFVIFPNMRIPERSIIDRVFTGEAAGNEVVEVLSWWESSDGTLLPNAKILVQVRSCWDGVRALIVLR